MDSASFQTALAQAKAFQTNGDWAKAIGALSSIAWEADYGQSCKAAKVASKLLKAGSLPSLSPIKIALIASSSTVFLEPLIPLFGLAEGFAVEVKSGDFGNWRQDILSEQSWLYKFDPDAVIIATHYRDAVLPAFSNDAPAMAESLAEEFEKYWQILRARTKAAVFQQGFDTPADDASGYLAYTHPGSRERVLRLADAALCRRAAANGVTMIDLSSVRARVGAAHWEDARLWHHAKQHPLPEALPELARTYARALRAKLSAPKKVCVVDLDNTLWGGVIGEDGLDGIRLGAPDAAGEAFAAFQDYLRELKARGILLAVCSKNNEADALLPFEKHSAMRLKRSDFAAFIANWQPKSQNIADIARQLNLGLDHFVFIDDTPGEIEEVKAALPEVECVLLSEDPSAHIATVAKRHLFDTTVLSQDDLRRNEMYRADAARKEAKAQSADIGAFLRSLSMRCTAAPVDGPCLGRVAQLLGKTNQFNLTTRRHSAEEIARLARIPGAFARCFQLADRFGDNGIVGVLIALPCSDGVLEIDSFVISCRVIGRGLEQFMFNELLSFAKGNGRKAIRGIYLPTPKNGQTADLYERLGFAAESASPEKATWILDSALGKPQPAFIEKAP